MGCAIIGCGKALPALDVTNDDLTKLVDTSDEWISKRTGIKSRKVAVSETSTMLAEEASAQALGWTDAGYHERKIAPEEIDIVIFASITPDVLVPSNAAIIRRRMGLVNAACFDLNAACAGFTYALNVAESLLSASAQSASRGELRRALIVCVDRLSRIVNWRDRNTCVVLGDGAGAVVLEYDPQRTGVMSTYFMNVDDDANALTCPIPMINVPPFDDQGVNPAMSEGVDPSQHIVDDELAIADDLAVGNPRNFLRMAGREVFKFSAGAMSDAVTKVCKRAGVSLKDVKLIVPHQANERIIDYAARRMDVPMDMFQLSIEHRGNTSAASVPMALTDAYEQGKIQRGDKVIVAAFGGGLTVGSALYEA